MKAARKRNPFEYGAAKRHAAELVTGWTKETLHDDGAAARLCHSWGLDYVDARAIVAGERAKRPL